MTSTSPWQPIETAPKSNEMPLYLARLDSEGNILELDYDGGWECWGESNRYCWVSAGGIKYPTHWAIQSGPPPQPAVQKPDASALVKALERIAAWPDGGSMYGQERIKSFASDTLAAHRKQGGGE